MRDPRNEDINFSLARVWSTNSTFSESKNVPKYINQCAAKTTKFICTLMRSKIRTLRLLSPTM